MPAAAVFVLLLPLLPSISADIYRCYDGTNNFKVIEVENAMCAFTVRYSDDTCTKNATIYKGKSDLPKHQGRSTCFYSFKRTAIICHCHGDLCNTDANIMKILTLELAKGAPKRMKKIVNCFLSQNDGKPPLVFGADPDEMDLEDDHKFTHRSNLRQSEKERESVKKVGAATKKRNNFKGQGDEKSSHFHWFPIIGALAVVVIIVDLALIVIILLLVMRSRRIGKETDDKEKSLRSSTRSRESEESVYPFPEYNSMEGPSWRAQMNRITDQEAVERIDAEIRREKKKERESERQQEEGRSRRRREKGSKEGEEVDDESSASQ